VNYTTPDPSDTTAPVTSLDSSGPSGTINYNDVSFSFSGIDSITSTPNLKYSYRLVGYDSRWLDPYTSSTSKNYPNLPNGNYTFEVKAKDEAGNWDTTPSSRSFTVNYTKPNTPIPEGLTIPSTADDDSGFRRTDNGDKHSNIDDGKPRGNIDYVFEIALKDTSTNLPTKVRLILNGYAHEMVLDSGNLTDGALYSTILKLGPAATHSFFYEALDETDNLIHRYPNLSELPGPAIELLNGSNMLGLAKDMTATGQGLVELFGSDSIYQWVSDGVTTDTNNGSFEALDDTSFPTGGKGYFVVNRELNATLPDLSVHPDTPTSAVAVDLSPGWNIISNPYGSHIKLSDVLVQRDTEPTVTWAEACTNRWLTNSIYTYLGSDWGSSYTFESVGGEPEAALTPWIGYWIYVIRNDADYKLIFTKP
jgi:hypothetical protein